LEKEQDLTNICNISHTTIKYDSKNIQYIIMAVSTASCKCGAVVFEMTGPPKLHAACLCNGCRLAGDYLVSKGGDSPKDVAGALPGVFFIQDAVKIVKGADQIKPFLVVKGSKTRRYYCKSCNSALGFSPFGFPMVGLHPTGLKGCEWPPLEARHSLEHSIMKHDEIVEKCKAAGDNVPWQDKQFAPCCKFLCPVICAKTCCAPCKGSKITEITAVRCESITEFATNGTDCDENTTIAVGMTSEVEMTRG
jgi:hypothetical protein